MLAELFPSTVSVVDSLADAEDAFLFPEEEAFIARAVDKRRREFTTARVCARAALSRLGIAPAPVVPGPRGAPRWPDGVVGSMTHCDGYRAAAVAMRREVLTVGLDAEPDAPLPEGVLRSIALPSELDLVAQLTSRSPLVHWDRLLFSAKETVYKAWFPLTGSFLDFMQARIDFDPVARTFTATLLVPGPMIEHTRLTDFHGRWLGWHGLVLTAVALPSR
jgi:enterobactin synthetase component D / holo-[acyl-carrier protein] synthase